MHIGQCVFPLWFFSFVLCSHCCLLDFKRFPEIKRKKCRSKRFFFLMSCIKRPSQRLFYVWWDEEVTQQQDGCQRISDVFCLFLNAEVLSDGFTACAVSDSRLQPHQFLAQYLQTWFNREDRRVVWMAWLPDSNPRRMADGRNAPFEFYMNALFFTYWSETGRHCVVVKRTKRWERGSRILWHHKLSKN